MKHRMPLYPDDHSILVTAEFWESGYLLKNGGSAIQRFEIDLITRDDITLEQFLLALYGGIGRKLQNDYGITPTRDDVQFLYWDDIKNPAGRKKGTAGEYMYPGTEESGLASEQQTVHNWLICWKLFCDCYAEYVKGYEETRERDQAAVFPAYMEPHPVISCGSIDKRVLDAGDTVRLTHSSQFWVDREHHGGKLLRDLGFVNSTRIVFDPAMWHRSDYLFGDAISQYLPQRQPPAYRVGNLTVTEFDDTPVHVLPPDKPDVQTAHYFVPMLTAPLLTTAVLLGTKGLGGQTAFPEHVFPYILGGAVVTAAVGLLGWCAHQRAIQVHMKMLCHNYQTYIRQLIRSIRKRQKDNAAVMRNNYPPVLEPLSKQDLVRMANAVDGDLFSRTLDRPDFLMTRLGLSKPKTRVVPSNFAITCKPADTVFSGVRYMNIRNTAAMPFTVLPPLGPLRKRRDGSDHAKFLVDLPADIVREYAYLEGAPVLLDVGRARAIGVLMQDSKMSFRPFLANLVLDLCFHHNPDDLQIVMLFRPTENESRQTDAIRYYKHLPHFRQLLHDYSPFAFDEKQAHQIMDRIHYLLNRKRTNPQLKLPHILLITEDCGWVQDHALSCLLPASEADTENNPNGITFLACSHFQRELPSFCTRMIKVTARNDWFLLPHKQTDTGIRDALYAFEPDAFPYRPSGMAMADEKDIYFRAFKSISAISCMKFGRSESIPMTGFPDMLSLYGETDGQMFEFYPEGIADETLREHLRKTEWRRYRDFYIQRNSSSQAPLDSLAVPVGCSEQSITVLDLHSAADGPNLLLLSDRSAGKTEFIRTYVCSLYMHYSAADIQLIVVDPNRAGLRTQLMQFSDYIISFHPDRDDFESLNSMAVGFAALDKVEKLMSEREIRFMMMGIRQDVHDPHCRLDLYNHYIRDLPWHAAERLNMSAEDAQLWMEKNKDHKHLPHVVLVLDNVEELFALAKEDDEIPDFLAKLQKILRNGPDYGIHVLLSARKLGSMIPREWLDKFQSRICFKHSNAGETLDCVGTALPAEVFYPENGRAYLYGTSNVRTVHFQVSYCGSDLRSGSTALIQLTYAPPSGPYELLFSMEVQREACSKTGWSGKDWKEAWKKQKKDEHTDQRNGSGTGSGGGRQGGFKEPVVNGNPAEPDPTPGPKMKGQGGFKEPVVNGDPAEPDPTPGPKTKRQGSGLYDGFVKPVVEDGQAAPDPAPGPKGKRQGSGLYDGFVEPVVEDGQAAPDPAPGPKTKRKGSGLYDGFVEPVVEDGPTWRDAAPKKR